MKNALIILDIDQTLIDSYDLETYRILLNKENTFIKPSFLCKRNNVVIWEREGLNIFFKYLDNNFKYIGIWTNGTQYWLNFVFDNILSKYLKKDRFILLFSIDKSINKIVSINNKNYYNMFIKDLNTIWHMFSKLNIDISNKNTLLIDDNFHNCYFNKNNSIPIRKFDILNNNKDNFNDTIKLLDYLKKSDNFSRTLYNMYNVHN